MGLNIKLFGGPVVIGSDDAPVRLPTRKSEALLAYLVERHGEEVPREVLADLLWSYSGPDQARASLRQEVSVLRKALGPDDAESIQSRGDRIAFCDETASVDLWRFREIAKAAEKPARQMEALALYTAPFLETFRIKSQPFSDWVWTTRQELESVALKLGTAALEEWAAADRKEHISAAAQHLCRIDPAYEPAHRALIELYHQRGDIHLALRQMRLCAEALKTHLDAEPSAETLSLMARLENRPANGNGQETAPALAKATGPRPEQRRYVTILSVRADIEIADPEDFDEAARDFAAIVRQIVEAKGGTQHHAFNDHVSACFGYPTTHDRETDTAVSAAVDILETAKKGTSRAANCRIGLSCGLALISEPHGPDQGSIRISGAVVSDAEALCRAASPGAIFVDKAVQTALSSAVWLKDLDDTSGAKQVIPRRTGVATRTRDLFPARNHAMVGRDAPLAHALGLLEQAMAGKGTAAAIIGNPGDGKSRLVQEVAEVAESNGFDIRLFQGDLSERQSTFAPVVDHMLRAGAVEDIGGEAAFEQLRQWLTAVSPELLPVASYFHVLLATPDNATSVPKQVRAKALDYFVEQARSATRLRPALLIFEDVQWFDPTTCDAVGRLVEVLAGTPACALLAARTGEAPDVLANPLVQQIQLTPLDPKSAEGLLSGLLKDVPVPKASLAGVLERAEGNPLIIEEFAKALEGQAERQSAASDNVYSTYPFGRSEETVALPDRLLPLLLSRIDSVPGAVQVLQHASVLGRRFALRHLSQILHPVAVRLPLFEELEAAGIVFASRHGADAAYIFKHALISQAIYSTIPKRSLTTLHGAAAQALLSDHSHAHDAEVARHFKAAGDWESAARHFELSGDKAARIAAHAEAISEYSDALAMVGHLPLSQERMRGELSLNRKIAAQIIGLRGIPTSEATPFYTAAQELSRELGDREEVVNATWGLWSIHLMVAELDDCLRTAEALRQNLDTPTTPAARLIVEYMLGVTHAYRGTLTEASTHLETVRRLDAEAMNEELRIRFGMDIGLTSDSFLAWVYALMNKTDQADAASERALARAQRNNTGLNLVFAHVFSATKCLFLNQIDEARYLAETALKGAEEMEFKQWVAQAKIQLARIGDLNGDPDALATLQEAMAEYLETGMVLARPYAQVWTAEALIRKGRPADALDVLDDLQRFTRTSKEQYFDGVAQTARSLALSKLAKPRIATSTPN